MILEFLLLLSFLLSALGTQAQYFQFSQFNLTPQRTTPASVAASDYEKIQALYRNQSNAGDLNISSSSFSYSRPLQLKGSGKRWGGFGIDALDDRSGANGLINRQNLTLTFGLNIPTGRRQSLSFALGTQLNTFKFSFDGLTTGSQYVAGRGFIQQASINESSNSDRGVSVGLNTGMLYQNLDKKKRRKYHAGFGFYGINKPNETGIRNKQFPLPVTSVFQFGTRIITRKNFYAYQEILWTISGPNSMLNLGVAWNYDISNSKKLRNFSTFSVHTRYLLGSYGHF